MAITELFGHRSLKRFHLPYRYLTSVTLTQFTHLSTFQPIPGFRRSQMVVEDLKRPLFVPEQIRAIADVKSRHEESLWLFLILFCRNRLRNGRRRLFSTSTLRKAKTFSSGFEPYKNFRHFCTTLMVPSLRQTYSPIRKYLITWS